VVENIRNISSTKFAEFQNFETYPHSLHKGKGRSSIMEVMGENFEYLMEENITMPDVLSLKTAPCVPVCAENTDFVTRPVMVRPIQVVALTSESVLDFMPFLNRLPQEFYAILPGILTKIGVEQSIMLKHIQGALETVHTLSDTHKLDVNSIKAVKN
jgi:hypothetical protein